MYRTCIELVIELVGSNGEVDRTCQINEKKRLKFSAQHYLKNNSEMSELFADLPEALENNYNFPFRCNFRPLFSSPILPNISSEKGVNADDILRKDSL